MGKYALIIVSALVFSIITYSIGLRNAMLTSTLRIVDTFSSNQAQNIAQSTMMVVMNDIRENGTGSQFVPVQGGSYQYPNNGLEIWNDINGSYRVVTDSSGDTLFVSITGSFEGRTSMARAGLLEEIPIWNPQFTSAVHSEGSIQLQGSASIKGDASTNSTGTEAVVLDWSTQIDSTLYIGPGGNPDLVVDEKNHAGNVGLGTEVLGEEKNYPMPQFPDYPPNAHVSMTGSSVIYGSVISASFMASGNSSVHFNEISDEDLPDLTVGDGPVYTLLFWN